MGLTLKQRLFINEYINTGNGAEAYRKVSPNAKNPNNLASQLLARPHIKEAIEAETKRIAEAKGITRDNALEILWNDARNAEKPVDRKGAVDSIAKIMGWTKENTSVNVAYFTQLNDNKEDTEKQ